MINNFVLKMRNWLYKKASIGFDIPTQNRFPGMNHPGNAIRNYFFSDLNYQNEFNYNAFSTYSTMVNIAFHAECEDILEIGAGISTVLWAEYGKKVNARITTVDADFSSLINYVGDSKHKDLVKNHVKQIQGVTITANQLQNFYERQFISEYCGVPTQTFLPTLERFLYRDSNRPGLTQKISNTLGKNKWGISEIFGKDGNLVFPRQIIDQYSAKSNFDHEIEFLQNYSKTTPTIIEQFQNLENQAWDFIFFDSGELSSVIEFELLEENIRVGGLAALHDIYFPKSMKNFLVAAYLLTSPKWKPIYIETSSIQGLLVAQKVL